MLHVIDIPDLQNSLYKKDEVAKKEEFDFKIQVFRIGH